MLTLEQKILRVGGLGGSDAAAICGLNPYKTARDVWLEKISGHLTDKTEEDDKAINPMVIGHLLEPAVVRMYEINTGFKVDTPKNTFFHEKIPYLIAHVDGVVVGQDKVLEVKTANIRQAAKWGKSGSDFIPDEYLMQCVHYALVLEKESVDIAVLIGGSDFRIYTYYRNRDLEEKYLQIAQDFWDCVQNKTIPTAKTKKEILGDHQENIADNDKELKDETAESIYQNIKELKEEIRLLEVREEESKKELIKILNNNQSNLLVDNAGNKLASIVHYERITLDTKKFSQEYGDVLEQFQKKMIVSSLRIN